jgi:hypothetical protein
MDFADFHIEPLPLETELRVISIQSRLKELSRQELEDYLVECLRLLTALTHQTSQMKNFLERLTVEG